MYMYIYIYIYIYTHTHIYTMIILIVSVRQRRRARERRRQDGGAPRAPSGGGDQGLGFHCQARLASSTLTLDVCRPGACDVLNMRDEPTTQ